MNTQFKNTSHVALKVLTGVALALGAASQNAEAKPQLVGVYRNATPQGLLETVITRDDRTGVTRSTTSNLTTGRVVNDSETYPQVDRGAPVYYTNTGESYPGEARDRARADIRREEQNRKFILGLVGNAATEATDNYFDKQERKDRAEIAAKARKEAAKEKAAADKRRAKILKDQRAQAAAIKAQERAQAAAIKAAEREQAARLKREQKQQSR